MIELDDRGAGFGGSSASCLARTPCVPLFGTLFNWGGTEGRLDQQRRAGIISIVRWNLRPVIFGVDLNQSVLV